MNEKPTDTPGKSYSLLTVMAGAFLAICISSILLSGGFQLFIYVNSQQKIIAANQTLIAKDAADSVDYFIRKKLDRLQTAMGLKEPVKVPFELQQSILYGLLGLEPSFQNLVLLDARGEPLSTVSRLSSPLAADFLNNLDTAQFYADRERGTSIGPIYIDDESNEPMVLISITISDVFGNFTGLLVAEVNLTFIWDLVARLKVGRTGQTYVVDKQGLLVAAYDTARVIRGENITLIDKVNAYINNPSAAANSKTTIYKGISGGWVIGTCIPLGAPEWAVITEMSINEAYLAVIKTILISLCVLFFIAVLAVGSGLVVARKIAVPILNLTNTASRIAAGEIGLHAKYEGPKEIVKLAGSFNRMKKRLTDMVRIEEDRTRELQNEILFRKKAEEDLRRYQDHLEELIRRRTQELEKEKEMAEAASRTKSEFLANMSHELRTPLNAVLGFSEILKMEENDEKKLKQLHSIHTSGNMLLSLINDILDLSKIESGKLELQYSATSIPALTKDLTLLFSGQTSEKGVDLYVEYSPDLPESLVLDETRLRQICVNLLGNAVKFTDKGYIRLTMGIATGGEASGSSIDFIITVEDSGRGIAREHIDKIFGAFEQVRDKDGVQGPGTGLGLAITKKFVEMMGGGIYVTSEPGQGSCFTVRLRDVEVAAVTEGGDQTGSFDMQTLAFDPAMLLIVDDIDYNREILGSYLRGYDFEIMYAEDGRQALEKTQAHKPDLILLDMKMPVMNGYQVSRKIKSDPQLSHTPIIAVTANALKSDVEEILNTCDAYLAKPVQKTQLVGEIARFLGHRQVLSPVIEKTDANINSLMLGEIDAERRKLPPELIGTLIQAAINCQQDLLYDNLETVEAFSGTIARIVRMSADEYDYGKILNILAPSAPVDHSG